MKMVKSNSGGKYYGRYTENGQCLGPFAKFLEKRGICAQHTMLGAPWQNDVAEMNNRTLMDMVRSMLCHSSLHLSLWMKVLKTTTYLLNMVLSKAVSKTPFKLLMERKSSLRHLYVWGCQADEKICTPHERKLNSITTSGEFH